MSRVADGRGEVVGGGGASGEENQASRSLRLSRRVPGANALGLTVGWSARVSESAGGRRTRANTGGLSQILLDLSPLAHSATLALCVLEHLWTW